MKLKKPKFWDYEKPNLFAFILYPLAVIFALISSLKKKSLENNLKIKTVCFGNIYIGDTGKTSLCLELNNHDKFNKLARTMTHHRERNAESTTRSFSY